MCYLVARCGRWCVILCLLLRCGSMLFKCELMSSCRFDRQEQQQHRNKRSRGEGLDGQSQSNVDSTNKEGVGHAASCRSLILVWLERRCRYDSIECELDAASNCSFQDQVPALHCPSPSIDVFWAAFADKKQSTMWYRLYDQGQSGLACLQRTIRELVWRSYLPSRQSRKHLSHSRVLQWCVEIEHVWTLLCDGGGSREFLQNKIGTICTIR